MKKSHYKRMRVVSEEITEFLLELPQSEIIKKINELQDLLEGMDNAFNRLRGRIEELDAIHDEAHEDWMEKSEKWQDSDKGEEERELIEKIDDFKCSIEEVTEAFEAISLTEIIESIEEQMDELTEHRGALNNWLDENE
jgi:superfamily I DNA/RNA helicase